MLMMRERGRSHLPAVTTAEGVAEVVVGLVLVGVVLVLAAVVVIVELLSTLLGLVLGALAVDVVGALGLGELVNLATGDAGQELLGEGVVDGLACMCMYQSYFLHMKDV
jgi:hypothetical protein